MNKDLMEFCSDPKCTYSFTHTLVDPDIHFCTRCGAKLITKCSKCENKFSNGTEKYCSNCGTIIKGVNL